MHGDQGIIEGSVSPAIYGLSGTELTQAEKDFFADVRPYGFILFARNCKDPQQVKDLTASLQELTGRSRLPILIDQEGGRVARLKPPHWRAYPPAQQFSCIAEQDVQKAQKAVYLNARLIADDLRNVGVTVNCAPLADIPTDGAHDIIGDRAFGKNVAQVTALARAQANGLIDGGVVPVLKHIPGHGRAGADSHEELPVVDTPLEELKRTDFEPFKQLADLPMGMTAHVLYRALDEKHMATVSASIIRMIREEIGFDGLLMSDDVSMKAMQGDFTQRVQDILAAGCDIVLHCNGKMNEMQQVAKGVGALSGRSFERAAIAMRAADTLKEVDVASIQSELEILMAA